MTKEEAEKLAERFIRFLETGKVPDGLFSPDVFCDYTSPRWREQVEGPERVEALRRRGHPGNGKVPRFRCDPTPTGFVLEVEEQWLDGGQSWYARELFRADVSGESIASISVYCTGDWDEARRAEHARAVQLLRP
jgi:hypothetical protein